MDNGEVYYTQHERLVVLKFVGQIRYTMGSSYRVSASLDAFLDELFAKKNFDNILIDLTQTESIDSTNLGLLARVAKFSQENLGRQATIISTNDDINAVLESVAFDRVFLILRDPHDPKSAFETVPDRADRAKELARLILDAHKTLMEIAETNQDKFRKVVEILEDQLRAKETQHD
ncbi:MAG TPA: STAS domain-containing protein [Candidatus Hydrogenedentes bacterium]|nr:STAS domain-containing protein [Candidatus Hydrogenedentota bacterium]HOS01822.1 STAS domain-containing protein [Candidatus Hydrogenedentota bacterium]